MHGAFVHNHATIADSHVRSANSELSSVIDENAKDNALDTPDLALKGDLAGLSIHGYISGSADDNSIRKKLFGNLADDSDLEIEHHDLNADAHEAKPATLMSSQSEDRRGVMHPAGAFRRNWDMLLAVAVLYCACAVPISASFNDDLPYNGKWCLIVMDWMADVFFICDILVNFNTAYVNQYSEVVFSRWHICLHYSKGWFAVDFFSTFPFHLLPDSVMGDAATLPKLLRLLRLFRLIKLLKLLKLANVVREMESELSGEEAAYIMKLSKLVFFITLCTHVNACLWHFMHALGKPDDDETLEADTWLISYWGLFNEDWRTKSMGQNWLASVYWTITTYTSVGYGDIIPQNDGERAFATMTEIIGALVFAFILGNLSSIISSHGAKEDALRGKMDEINLFIRARCLPREVAGRVRRFYERYYEKKIVFNEEEIVNTLSQNLKQEVACLVYETLIECCPFLANSDPSFVTHIVTSLRSLAASKNETILDEGRVGNEMFIISIGQVECYCGKREHARKIMRLEEGSYFGEDGVINETCIRKYNVRSTQRSELYSLSKVSFDEASWNFPEVRMELETVAEMREAILKPSDVYVSVADTEREGQAALKHRRTLLFAKSFMDRAADGAGEEGTEGGESTAEPTEGGSPKEGAAAPRVSVAAQHGVNHAWDNVLGRKMWGKATRGRPGGPTQGPSGNIAAEAICGEMRDLVKTVETRMSGLENRLSKLEKYEDRFSGLERMLGKLCEQSNISADFEPRKDNFLNSIPGSVSSETDSVHILHSQILHAEDLHPSSGTEVSPDGRSTG
ncbi:hypothetical protein CYMTET_55268 [Cymbomonas tetramitiformis]|uniref:Cyclic nucleotide-binding domain-containing protein n=1 Tax=Cymbomonas tetramitiformis TaxID=36881 RepID=A0AAE0BF23_9CHLO|nr:hypothetical protein CYMTET_55268 [Cymbomonas tetramitiformis]